MVFYVTLKHAIPSLACWDLKMHLRTNYPELLRRTVRNVKVAISMIVPNVIFQKESP